MNKRGYIVKVSNSGTKRVPNDSADYYELYDAVDRSLLDRKPTRKALVSQAEKKGITIVDGPDYFKPTIT
jgi:hypothetical protein